MSGHPGRVAYDTPSQRYPLYAHAGAFRNVVTPLTWSTLFPRNERAYRKAFSDLEVFDQDEFDQSASEILLVLSGYAFNSVCTMRLLGARTPGLTADLVEFQFMGSALGPEYDIQEPECPPVVVARISRSLEAARAMDLETLLREDRAAVDEFLAARPDLSEADDFELWERFCHLLADYEDLFGRFMWVTLLSGIHTCVITRVCRDELGDPTLPMRLLSGIGEVESSAPTNELWSLSRIVLASPVLSSIFDQGVDDVEGRLGATTEGRRLVKLVTAFLGRHGSRGQSEWEIRSPTFETEPRLFYSVLDRIRTASERGAAGSAGSGQTGERQILIDETLQSLKDQRGVVTDFASALADAVRFTKAREQAKTTVVRLLHEGRLAMLELGRRGVQRGFLRSKEQMTLLLFSEVEEFLRDPDSLRELIVERQAQYDELAALQPPDSIYGSVPVLDTWSRRDGVGEVAPLLIGESIRGIGANPGKIIGRARVITDPLDPGALQTGDILVAPVTDPGWMPLFLAASGVLVDSGSQISHAAVVSRELGVPCVVQAPDATKRIANGTLIELDGTSGIVTVVG